MSKHLRKHINKTKAKFIVFVGVVIFCVVAVSFALKYNHSFSAENLQRNTGIFKYQIAVFKEKHPGLFDKTYDFSFNDLPQNKNALSVPVLVYHGITDQEDRFNIDEESFREHMSVLKNAGYTTITAQEFIAFNRGEITLPDRSFLLTFDDGRKDSFYGADPILRAVGFNAVMFVATNYSLPSHLNLSTYYLNSKELNHMMDTGRWEIASHMEQESGGIITIDRNGTKGNFLSNKKWLPDYSRLESDAEYKARVYAEIARSREIINQNLKIDTQMVSYPFGDYGQQSINNKNQSQNVILENVKNNYSVAFRQIWPIDKDYSQNYVKDEPYLSKRMEPSPKWTGTELLAYLESGHAKSLPFYDDFRINNGWKTSWGKLSINNNKLNIGSNDSSSGGFAFLDGAYLWKNYLYTANIDWNTGSHVFLTSRLHDDEDYISCVFSDEYIYIKELEKNVNYELFRKKTDSIIPKENVNLSMSIENGYVNCIADGKILLSGKVEAFANGGIGFKTWDEKGNNTDIVIKSISVMPLEGNLSELLEALKKKI